MKTFFISICLFITALHVSGQNDDVMPACVMAHGGVNLTTLNQNYFYSSDARIGYQAGASFRTNGDFYFQAGMQFVQVNPVFTYDGTDSSDKVSMKYFQVPVLAGVQIVKSKDMSRTMHATLGGSFTTLFDVSENELGITQNDLRTFGFTVKAGLGAEFGKFFTDLNYNLLVTKVYDVPGYNNKAKLMCWELNVGYKFNLKKKDKSDDN